MIKRQPNEQQSHSSDWVYRNNSGTLQLLTTKINGIIDIVVVGTFHYYITRSQRISNDVPLNSYKKIACDPNIQGVNIEAASQLGRRLVIDWLPNQQPRGRARSP